MHPGSRLLSIGTALPPLRVSQPEALGFLLKNLPIRPATKALYRRVFAHASVQHRHFAVSRLRETLDKDHDRKNARFEREGVRLSAASLRRALRRAGRRAKDVDYLAVTTCTGYVCPGLAAQTADAAGLRSDISFADLVGMGCGAALPGLRAADDFCRAHPGALAAVVSTEICSAALFSDDEADLVISNALFGDGSAAALLSADRGPGPRLMDFQSLLVPAWRDTLRFRSDGGHLRNVLGKEVPSRSGAACRIVLSDLLKRNRLFPSRIGRYALHAGGARVLAALASALDLAPDALDAARAVLRRAGNLSSPAVLFVLEESLRRRPSPAGEWTFLASFGAGFSAHGALVLTA